MPRGRRRPKKHATSCRPKGPIAFSTFLADYMFKADTNSLRVVGAGTYGIVFEGRLQVSRRLAVLKFIPLPANTTGSQAKAPPTTYEEACTEVRISGTMSGTQGFPVFAGAWEVCGSLPTRFRRVIERWHTEADLVLSRRRRQIVEPLEHWSRWIIIRSSHAGSLLPPRLSPGIAVEVLRQVVRTLQEGEGRCKFEVCSRVKLQGIMLTFLRQHRDLSLGNILIKEGSDVSAVVVTIVDFGFARCERDGQVFFNDLSRLETPAESVYAA